LVGPRIKEIRSSAAIAVARNIDANDDGNHHSDNQYQPIAIVHRGATLGHSPRMYAVVITLPVAGVIALLKPGPPKPKVSP